jgi:hypothetical protein
MTPKTGLSKFGSGGPFVRMHNFQKLENSIGPNFGPKADQMWCLVGVSNRLTKMIRTNFFFHFIKMCASVPKVRPNQIWIVRFWGSSSTEGFVLWASCYAAQSVQGAQGHRIGAEASVEEAKDSLEEAKLH